MFFLIFISAAFVLYFCMLIETTVSSGMKNINRDNDAKVRLLELCWYHVVQDVPELSQFIYN